MNPIDPLNVAATAIFVLAILHTVLTARVTASARARCDARRWHAGGMRWTGGGLTVIANAKNPAGQPLLARYFDRAVERCGSSLGALIPTLIGAAAFRLI